MTTQLYKYLLKAGKVHHVKRYYREPFTVFCTRCDWKTTDQAIAEGNAPIGKCGVAK